MSLVLGESGVLAGLLSFIYRLAILIYPGRACCSTCLSSDRVRSTAGKKLYHPRPKSFAVQVSHLYLPVFRVGTHGDSCGGQHLSCLTHIARCGLKILVCMKQVPQKDAPLKLNESGRWIREDISYEVNEPDAYALEEALRQKEKHGGEVVVVTAGPVRSQQVLREALAKGADRAIHLEGNEFVSLDAINTAKAIREAIKGESFDLIFTGLQSDDYGFAQTGVVLSELLGWPHATIIMQIEKKDGGIRVKRELESGYFQFVEMPLPALLTIQSGINKLRYATLIGIKQAKNKPLRKVTFAEIQSALGPNLQQIQRLYIPQKTKKTEMLEGTSAEIAKKLVEKLRNEVRVL